MSRDQNPCEFSWLYMDYNKPLQGSLLATGRIRCDYAAMSYECCSTVSWDTTRVEAESTFDRCSILFSSLWKLHLCISTSFWTAWKSSPFFQKRVCCKWWEPRPSLLVFRCRLWAILCQGFESFGKPWWLVMSEKRSRDALPKNRRHVWSDVGSFDGPY